MEAPLHVGLPEWIDDLHFDAGYHVRHISLPPPGAQRELLDLAATLPPSSSTASGPLWEAYWIDGWSRAPPGGVLLQAAPLGGRRRRLDGAVAGPHPAEPRRAAAAHRHRPARPAAGAGGEPVEQLATLAADNAAAWCAWRAAPPRRRRRCRAIPARASSRPSAWRGVRGVLEDLFTPTVVDPLDRGCSGLSRRFDVMAIPLARLQRLKAKLEVTINDAVLTALAGALGAYHRQRHVHVETLNCMVPINLRSAGEKDQLGNRVGTFTVRPLAERDLVKRLRLITAQTHAAKSDRRGAAAPLVLQGVALLPGFAMRWIARRSLGRINLACTNVPGLRERRYMAGARVDALYPFASVVEGTPLVVALMSYAGVMHVGFDTDPEAIPDPERIHALYEAALAELSRHASAPPPPPAGAGRIA
ncbi:MAG: WS/DGAT domain-containing protein [Candidatus Binatia bacterium]